MEQGLEHRQLCLKRGCVGGFQLGAVGGIGLNGLILIGEGSETDTAATRHGTRELLACAINVLSNQACLTPAKATQRYGREIYGVLYHKRLSFGES